MAFPVILVAMAVAAVAAAVGKAIAAGQESEAARIIKEAAKEYDIPPEVIAEHLGPSALEAMKADPALRDAQMGAVDAFRRSAQAGGLDPQAKAQLDEGLNAARGQEQSQRQAILDSYRRRGMGNSGFELASQLQGAQSGANLAHRSGLQAGNDAANRALEAWRQSAGLAGDVRSQDYTEASNLANARDRIAQFNLQNRQDARTREWENRYRLADARYRVAAGAANVQIGSAASTREAFDNFGQSTMKAGGGYDDWRARQDYLDQMKKGTP